MHRQVRVNQIVGRRLRLVVQQARKRNHRTIIRTELGSRIINFTANAGHRLTQPGSQQAVCANAAGDDQAPAVILLRGTD